MKKGFTTFLSALKANTPPCKKGLSSLRFLSIFLILFLGIGQMWAAYTPTADEVIILNDVYNADATDAGYSTHAAIAWAGTASPNSKKAGDPANNGESTSSNVKCFSVKGNGGGKNLTVSITGCSKIIIYHEKQSSRYVELRKENKEGEIIGKSEANTYFTEITLDGSTSYDLFFHGINSSNGDQDFYIYAIKLIKAAPSTAKLTWDFDGGSCSGTEGTDYTAGGDVNVGTVITYPDASTMSKVGYNFNGWDSDETEMPDTDLTITAQWVPASATESAINYAETKGADMSAYPATYYEGVGIESFDPLTDVVDYHFVGWNPTSIGTEATGAQTITAQWTPAYNIVFSAGTGTGEVPDTFQKWEGATFELPAQGALVAPTGKEFAGWSDGTNTYAAGATYTMGAAAVTFTAQWKAAPTVIFHYQWTGSSTQPAVGDVLTGIGGTITVERKEGSEKNLSTESAKFVSSVPSDMKFTTSDSKGVKFGTGDVWFRIALNSGNFEEGDMIAICGYEAFLISSSTAFDGDISSSLSTGSNKENYEVNQCVIPSIESFPNLYIKRVSSSCGFAAIKVIRPAQKEILSTDITLSAVTVNTEPISAENLATLKTDYKLALTSEYAEAPTVAFTKQTVITYEDATTKTTTEEINVVATKVDGKWQAKEEINAITYTVTAVIPATYTVIYKDGTETLDEEIVKVGEHPTAEGVESKPLYTLSWKLDEEVVELSNVNGTADQEITLTAVWTPKYATSLDFAAITTAGTTGDNPIVDFLASGNMIASNLGSSEWETSTDKSGYVGYKLKNNGATITFLAQEDKRVTITFGSIAADVTLKKGDETVTISAKSGDDAETVYKLDVTTDMVVAITTSSGSTVTLKSITIGDIPEISDNATLKDLKVNGTTIDGFNSATKIYYFTVPYGTEVANMPKITEATADHASATAVISPTDAPEWTEEYGGCYLQQVVVTAEDGTKGYYHVRTTVDAKQGVSLIKATHDGTETGATVTGYIGGTVEKKTQENGKLGSNGHYFGIKLAEGTFESGDVIKVVASALNGGNTITLFADNEGTTEIGSVAYDQSTKTAYFTLTADVENVYIYRVSSACNSNVEYIEVQRYMAPFIETFEVAGAQGVVDQENKTITVEVPASTDVTALTPTIVAWANGGATVTPTDAQDFTNPVTYSVASAYAEDGTTEYTVTVTKALPSSDATLATLTYNGTNITLVPDQYTYDIELPKGTTVVPTVTYTTNHTGATAVKTDAAVLPGATTIIVTAEDGTTQQNYTINFTVSTSDIITIFDGSTMSNIATSPSGAISWEIVGSTMGAGDKNISYNDVTYTRALSCGNSSETKHLKIVVADNNKAQFEIIGMSNSSSDTRHAWLTNSTDKGEFANAIAGLTSNGYNPAKFTTDWLEEGTYYLHSDNTVAILLIRVKAEPVPAKCEAPTISGLADVAVCDLSSALLDGTATVSDGGTVTYKWYAEGDAETVLATTATYAPTTVGNYYVVATNSLADHRDNSTTSSVVIVRIKTAPVITTEVLDQHAEAGNNVTLSVVATDAESYQWYTCDDAAGTNPVEVVGATDASLEVAVTSGMSQYYKVIISNTCGSAESIGKVEEWTELPQADVTESITWDWAAESMGTIETVSGSTEYLMANVSSAVPNNENFRSDMLLITAKYANRSESQQFFQGTKIRFNTTVDGIVRVYFRSTGNDKNVEITINGTSAGSGDAFQWSNYIEVPAGDVTIVGTGIGDNATGLTRIQKIEFLALGYTRDVNVGELATVCLPNACVARDVEVYELVGKEPQYGKIVFDEILSGELMAGKPYLLRVTNPKAKFYYTVDAPAAEPNNSGAMKGTFVDMTLTDLTNIYYFAQKALWSCVDLTKLTVPANRAYVNMAEMPDASTSNPAPGVRRVTLGVNGQNVTTGVENVDASTQPTKVLINGQLFILRGEKMYDATGKLVK